ncbi:uncharacterized protein [Diadema antillarum]|uniref:uncharacterized protein n=1 Tax=Diadema antillarum TaxID=105358 RepID=UPI003A8931F2
MGKKTGTMDLSPTRDMAAQDEHCNDDVERPNNDSKMEADLNEQSESYRKIEDPETESKQEKDEEDTEKVGKEEAKETAVQMNGGGDIEMKFILRGHAQSVSSTKDALTPNTARKRKKHLHHHDDVSMAEVISITGIESLYAVSNHDAMSLKDCDGEDGDEEAGDEEEEEEQGIGVHHVLAVILALVSVAIILLLYFLVPCPCEPEDWNVQLASLASKSPVRLVDVNRDGMDDIVFGYGNSLDYNSIEDMEQYCSDRNVTVPCGGGVMAMNGWRGDKLWEVRTNQTITSLVCGQLDCNQDGQSDCLAAGYDGQILAIDSRSAQVLSQDLDEDGVLDLVVTHGQEIEDDQVNATQPGRLLLLSGKTGRSLGGYLDMPDAATTTCPPVVYQATEDSPPQVVFGSGTAKSQGSMWMVELDQLLCHVTGTDCTSEVQSSNKRRSIRRSATYLTSNSQLPVTEILRGEGVGFHQPAIVADMTQDGTNDLILTSADARVTVVNGTSMQELWSVADYATSHEVLSLPAPGHFNDDSIPDILLHLSAVDSSADAQDLVVILDGRNGKELWLTVSMPGDLSPLIPSPLSLKMDDYRDAFTFWLQSQDEGEMTTTTEASGGDWCSDFAASLSTLRLVIMDRDMAFSPAVLLSASSYVYYSNSSGGSSPDPMSTSEPSVTTATGSHLASSSVPPIPTDPSQTTVLDITSMLNTRSDAISSPPSNWTSTSLPPSSASSTWSTGSARRRRDVSPIPGGGCYQMIPTVTSTGVIGDLDNDGSLELIVLVNMLSTEEHGDQSTSSTSGPRQHLAIHRFWLEEAVDQKNRPRLDPTKTYLDPGVGNSSFGGDLFGHFDLMDTNVQSWWGYMGTDGSGWYI